MTYVELPDPLMAAPFKISNTATPDQKAYLESHAWPINPVPMRAEHARFWDEMVVPRIKRIEQERLQGFREGEAARADAYWQYSWSTIYRVLAGIVTWSAGSRPTWTPSVGWVLESPTPKGIQPVAMILGLMNTQFPRPLLPLPNGDSVPGAKIEFLWLITTAPAELIREWGIPHDLSLGKVVLDTAIQISYAYGLEGCLLLHADPVGGAPLTRFYSEQCKMLNLSSSNFPKVTRTRQNDGRYYYFDSPRAGVFAQALHGLRRSVLHARGYIPTTPRKP